MDKIQITPTGGWLIAKMLQSCGLMSCDSLVCKLDSLQKPVLLSSLYSKERGGWLKPVFGNLKAYAIDEGIDELDVVAVARYFGGKHHINHMIPKSRASNISYELGEAAGLVLDVLLPLEGNRYINNGLDLVIEGGVEVGGLGGQARCYHRGLIVILPLSEEDVSRILADQLQSKDFVTAIKRLKSPVSLKPEHQIAIKDQA